MHTTAYRNVFSHMTREWCAAPAPARPLSFEAVGHATVAHVVRCRIPVGRTGLYNLVLELWTWNQRRFSRHWDGLDPFRRCTVGGFG